MSKMKAWWLLTSNRHFTIVPAAHLWPTIPCWLARWTILTMLAASCWVIPLLPASFFKTIILSYKDNTDKVLLFSSRGVWCTLLRGSHPRNLTDIIARSCWQILQGCMPYNRRYSGTARINVCVEGNASLIPILKSYSPPAP